MKASQGQELHDADGHMEEETQRNEIVKWLENRRRKKEDQMKIQVGNAAYYTNFCEKLASTRTQYKKTISN